MRFTLPTGMDEPTVTTMKVSDAETKTSGDTTFYIFKCAVAAKEMASDIRAQIIDGNKTGTEYTYSVKEYAEYLLDHPETDGYADAAPVVKAMLNYGAYSQVDFDKASVALANEKLTKEEKDVSGIQAQTINRDDYSVSVPEGTEFLGATLSLKSKTTLSLYFRSGQNLTFSCTGRQLKTVNEDGYQIVRIRNIEAKNLSNSFEVNITAGDAQGSVSYSPMNYCYMALKSDNATGALKDVVRALYNYWVAAEAYF